MTFAKASLLVGACALAVAPALGGCNGTFRFDEPLSTDGGGGGTGGTDDAGAPRARCDDDTTCGGLRCDTSSGECVACLVQNDCAGALAHCDTTLHACVACLETADCGTLQRCDPTTRRCLDTCVDDDDPCPLANFVCNHDRRLCVECTSSANCAGSPNGAVCDVPIGRCVECTANAKCPMSKPVCDRRTGRCVGCLSSVACSAGNVCNSATLECTALP